MERWLAAAYAEELANLEVICEETVTMDEGRNPIRLDADGLAGARAYLKDQAFPGDEAAHVRIDAFLTAGPTPMHRTRWLRLAEKTPPDAATVGAIVRALEAASGDPTDLSKIDMCGHCYTAWFDNQIPKP
jgi:hypothetical protein